MILDPEKGYQFRSKLILLAKLLSDVGGNQNLASSLKAIIQETSGDTFAMANNVLKNIGGMGALNDHVFYSNGEYDVERNRAFNTLISDITDLGCPYIQNEAVKLNAMRRGRQAAQLAEYKPHV